MSLASTKRPAVSQSMAAAYYAALALFCLFAWWTFANHYDLLAAWKGFSPIGYVYEELAGATFRFNFPSGIQAADASALMLLYKGAYAWFSLAPEYLLPIVIGIEIAALALAVIVLARTLLPESPIEVVILLVLLVVASGARDMNLARFGQPFFAGQYYVFADVCRLGAIVSILRGRHLLSAAFLGAAVVIHPMLGLMGAVFVGVAALGMGRKFLDWSNLVGATMFLAVCAIWLFLVVGPGAVSNSEFPRDDWLVLTRLNNFHWYPVDNGMLTEQHERRFLPFLSFLLVLTCCFWERRPLNARDRGMATGFLAMAGLSVAGLLISVFVPVPALIKLSLHRSNDLIILVGLIYVAAGLWNAISAGRPWRAMVAALILASPFVVRPGFPVLLSFLFVLPVVASVVRGHARDGWALGLTALAFGILILVAVYAVLGWANGWRSAYVGWTVLEKGHWMVVALVLATLALRWRPTGTWGPQAILVLCFVLGATWLWDHRPLANAREEAVAQDYMKAQLWARANTKENALFMPDPTHYYGWRDYSRRPSFGNLREWLQNGWMYTSDLEIYKEGRRRFAEFGIDLAPYLAYERPLDGFRALSAAIRKRYYEADPGWRAQLARKYGISYFVFFKRYMTGTIELPRAFENDSVIIAGPAERTGDTADLGGRHHISSRSESAYTIEAPARGTKSSAQISSD